MGRVNDFCLLAALLLNRLQQYYCCVYAAPDDAVYVYILTVPAIYIYDPRTTSLALRLPSVHP